jgi:transposase
MNASNFKVKDFTGHNIYVGIDVHFKSWAVSIYCDEFELKTFTQSPDVDHLFHYLSMHYPKATYHVAYEAGLSGFWIQRAFSQKGIDCKVIHPADVPSSQKETKRKTDKVDSRKIAKGLKTDMLRGIFIPEEEQEADRQILRSRAKLVKDITRLKNRIKSFLKLKGISIPQGYDNSKWTISFIKWLGEVDLSASNKITLDFYLDELHFLTEKEKQLRQAIKELSLTEHYSKNVQLLTTMPGVALIAAMTISTEIGDIRRFKKLDHLNSYCGLAPNTHSSGATERVTGISRMGNAIIKSTLIECSWMAIRKDPALLLYYKQCLPRMCANKAIIKVTRKMLNRIRFVLLNQQEYVKGVME